MLYIPIFADFLKTLFEEEVKDFVLINFDEYFKCTREKRYSKLSEEKDLEKLLNRFIVF